MELNFLIILLFVFVLSALIMILAAREPSSETQLEETDPNDSKEDLSSNGWESFARMIDEDEDLLRPHPPVGIPHIPLPGVRLGGGAADELCSKSTCTLTIDIGEDPNEKRKYNRRLGDRRTEDIPVAEERRLIQRRVWLRRQEDRRGKTLLTVTDAAQTLGVTVEQIYKWLDESDIPFYQITEGKRKAIRFEISELFQWYRGFASQARDLGQDKWKGQ